MYRVCLAMAVCAVTSAAQDANAIILRSVERDSANVERLKNYTYEEREEFREYDSKGKVTSAHSKTNEVMMLAGRHYQRLTKRDDKPLSANENRKEQEKLDKELAKRQSMAAAEHARLQKGQAEQRKFVREIP